jgi:hypothetical protein
MCVVGIINQTMTRNSPYIDYILTLNDNQTELQKYMLSTNSITKTSMHDNYFLLYMLCNITHL